MLVILKENVENLGRVGDVVKVADGYARNFLIPRKLVSPADAKNVAAIEHQKKMLDKKRAAQKATAEDLAAKINAASITITRKVGDKDKMFGSVSAGDIHDALKANKIEIEKRQIELHEHIKTLGVHNVTIHLIPEVTTTLKVWVTKEGA